MIRKRAVSLILAFSALMPITPVLAEDSAIDSGNLISSSRNKKDTEKEEDKDKDKEKEEIEDDDPESEWKGNFKLDTSDVEIPDDYAEKVDEDSLEVLGEGDSNPMFEFDGVSLVFNVEDDTDFLYIEDRTFKDGYREFRISFKDDAVFSMDGLYELLQLAMEDFSKKHGFDNHDLVTEIMSAEAAFRKGKDDDRVVMTRNGIESLMMKIENGKRGNLDNIILGVRMNPVYIDNPGDVIRSYKERMGGVSYAFSGRTRIFPNKNMLTYEETYHFNEEIPVIRKRLSITGTDKTFFANAVEVLERFPRKIRKDMSEIVEKVGGYEEKHISEEFETDLVRLSSVKKREFNVFIEYFTDEDDKILPLDDYVEKGIFR